MIEKQKTIKSEVTLSGVGLHTGHDSTVTFKPAPENYGFVFVRVDLPGHPEVPADVNYVVDLSRGTTIQKGEARVHTVEHVLASLVGLQIDNCRIEISAPEPPVMDGSAKPFVDALLEAGTLEQTALKDYLVIDQTIQYVDEARGVQIVGLPADDFRLTVMVDYNNPALGSQHTGMFTIKEFVEEFASARTFCFLTEVEMLAEQGLIKGGDIDNAVVIVDRHVDESELTRLKDKLKLEGDLVIGNTGFLNNKELRYKNEPARHKLLDLMGDLALIGAPLKGQVLAARPGHAANIAFVKELRKLVDARKLTRKFQHVKKEGVIFDIQAIERILPHRYPFLLIDRIIDFKLDERITAIKNVTRNEPFFNGHFPGQAVMPGVLIVEAMAQAGGILLLNGIENAAENLVYFMSIDNCKFRKPVTPGDQLIIEMEMVSRRRKICSIKGKAMVDGAVVCEAEMMASIVERG